MRNIFCHHKTITSAFPIFLSPLSLPNLLVAASPRHAFVVDRLVKPQIQLESNPIKPGPTQSNHFLMTIGMTAFSRTRWQGRLIRYGATRFSGRAENSTQRVRPSWRVIIFFDKSRQKP
jgi:hypothetical protein